MIWDVGAGSEEMGNYNNFAAMLKYILLGFTIYFAYRFLFDFLIPVVRTTRQVKKQFDAVKEQQQGFQQNQGSARPESANSKAPKPPADDYIEFEEIR